MNCYSFNRSCMPPLQDDPCAELQETSTVTICPQTAIWFWIGAALVVAGALLKK